MRSSSIVARGRLTMTVPVVFAIVLSGFQAGSVAWAQGAGAQPDEPGPDDSNTASAATPDNTAATPDPSGQNAAGGDTASDAAGAANAGDTTTGDTTTEIDTSKMPVNLRLRRLEQRVQALKERAWRAKARVGMLKEAVLGGGVGATASVIHKNKMGSSFRLIQLVYALDGTQVFARADDSGSLHKEKSFEVLTGPIAPGSHTISVLAVYRGHGYGVFKYLTKYKFTVRSSHTFTVSEGKATRIEAVGFERGGVTTPLEERPAIDFKVTHSRGPGSN